MTVIQLTYEIILRKYGKVVLLNFHIYYRYYIRKKTTRKHRVIGSNKIIEPTKWGPRKTNKKEYSLNLSEDEDKNFSFQVDKVHQSVLVTSSSEKGVGDPYSPLPNR